MHVLGEKFVPQTRKEMLSFLEHTMAWGERMAEEQTQQTLRLDSPDPPDRPTPRPGETLALLAVSPSWQDLDLVRDTLRKLYHADPKTILRVPAASRSAKEMREFAEILGFRVDVWSPVKAWGKRAAECRNAEMLWGFDLDPYTLALRATYGKPSLLVAFWNGKTDNTKHIIDQRLRAAEPLVVYREKWVKKRGRSQEDFTGLIERAVNHPRRRFQLGEWKPVLREVRKEAA